MLTLVLVSALSAAPQAKLAAPGLTGVQVPKDEATFYSDHLAQQLALRGLAVVTASDMSSLLGLERQKQLMGCTAEATSCQAELADALGADGVVTGSIAKLDQQYQINVVVVASNNGRKLASYSGTARGRRDMLDTLTSAAEALAEQVLVSLNHAPNGATAVSLSDGGARRFWGVPAGIGVAGLVVGAIFTAFASGHASALRGSGNGVSSLSYADALNERSAGSLEQNLAIAGFAVGGAALLAAGALYLFGAPVSAAPIVGPGAGGFVLQGALP